MSAIGRGRCDLCGTFGELYVWQRTCLMCSELRAGTLKGMRDAAKPNVRKRPVILIKAEDIVQTINRRFKRSAGDIERSEGQKRKEEPDFPLSPAVARRAPIREDL